VRFTSRFRISNEIRRLPCVEKNEEENIGKGEVVALKRLASELFRYDDKTIVRAVASGALIEVICDEKTIR
jgi:hypothetical protein